MGEHDNTPLELQGQGSLCLLAGASLGSLFGLAQVPDSTRRRCGSPWGSPAIMRRNQFGVAVSDFMCLMTSSYIATSNAVVLFCV